MKTIYSACLSRLGLSRSEAAAVHGNSLHTIKARCAGKIRVPQGVWDDLRAYEAVLNSTNAADDVMLSPNRLMVEAIKLLKVGS